MKKEVLVYDNQLGYYNLLKDTFKGDYKFSLFKEGQGEQPEKKDMVVFFLHDEIELIDVAKLYTEDVPFVVGCSKIRHCLQEMKNIYTVSLIQTKDEIIKSLLEVFETVAVAV